MLLFITIISNINSGRSVQVFHYDKYESANKNAFVF